MTNIVIFGAPGSGKGTQSEKLIDKYGFFHISTGDLLRDHIARQTDLGKIADSFISKGNLIPDDLMTDILADFIDSNPEDTRHGVILDGFPRTIAQADKLNQMFCDRGMQLDHVIGLEADDDELVDRLVKRGAASGRSDDNPQTITKRLEVYHNQTQPLRQYYIDRGLYRQINATGHVDDIHSRIAEVLEQQ